MKVAYFVHDLNDAAVRKRVQMFQIGGANVVVLGFERSGSALAEIEGAPVTNLGHTHDRRLGHRAMQVLGRLVDPRIFKAAADADVLVARNLEMLALARRALGGSPHRALVYECLDIHRAMLGSGVLSMALRAFERWLLRSVTLLIVSSPAFLREYFQPRQHVGCATLLLENKVLDVTGDAAVAWQGPSAGPPWRIGWFGVIRCRKSLAILQRLLRALEGRMEVIIAGRPARQEFDDFDRQVEETPGMSFEGSYRHTDLADLYNKVHFVWAIDYFEEGLNSKWLLPNRLYEGGLHGAVPIALGAVETGAWLQRRGAGVLLRDPDAELPAFFRQLTPEAYAVQRKAVAAIPAGDLRADRATCIELVAALKEAKS